MITKKLNGFQCEMEWMGKTITTLRDIIEQDLDVLFIGSNPTPHSVKIGHYYQGENGEKFLKLLVDHKIIPEPEKNRYHDEYFIDRKFGLTDIVKRPTKGQYSLLGSELCYGKSLLIKNINKGNPKILFFVYKKPCEELLEQKIYGKDNWGFFEQSVFIARMFLFPSFSKRNNKITNIGNIRNEKIKEFKEELDKL